MRTPVRILSIFAAIWAVVAVLGAKGPVWLAALCCVPSLGLIAWTGWRRTPDRFGENRRRTLRLVRIWSLAEAALIFAALAVASALHATGWYIPLIVAAVGLHFVPLAAQLPQRLYYATAALLIVDALAAIVLPPVWRDSMEAAAAAVILWGSAALLLRG